MADKSIILINPKTFKPAWNAVRGIRPSKTVIPVLDYAHLEIAESGLGKLTCSNLDVEGAATFQASASAAQKMLLPAAICDWMAGFDEGEITLRLDEATFRVHANMGRSRTSMASLTATDYPVLQVPEPDFTLQFSPADLLPALETALMASSTEETRYYLQAVVVEVDGADITIMATDGKRLHLTGLQAEGDPPKKPLQILIHRDHVKAILRGFSAESAEPVTLKGNDRQATLANGTLSITGKQVDATYPDWRRVVPEKASDGRMKLKPAEMKNILARMKLLRGGGDIVLELKAENGEMTLRCKRALAGDNDIVEDALAADAVAAGHAFVLLDYFLDALGAGLSENALMDITAPDVPALRIEDEDRGKTIVIMQRRGF